jgi:hypothetical protein
MRLVRVSGYPRHRMAVLGDPKNVVEWPLWLVNCGLSEVAFLAINLGEPVFSAGLILLLALRILRTRGLDRRIYVPVHIASIVGALTAAALAVSNLAFWSSDAPLFGNLYPGLAVCIAIAVIPVMLFLANIGRR